MVPAILERIAALVLRTVVLALQFVVMVLVILERTRTPVPLTVGILPIAVMAPVTLMRTAVLAQKIVAPAGQCVVMVLVILERIAIPVLRIVVPAVQSVVMVFVMEGKIQQNVLRTAAVPAVMATAILEKTVIHVHRTAECAQHAGMVYVKRVKTSPALVIVNTAVIIFAVVGRTSGTVQRTAGRAHAGMVSVSRERTAPTAMMTVVL